MRAIIVSAITHVVVIGAVFIASVLAPDILPIPRHGTRFTLLAERMVRLQDVELPPVRPRTAAAPNPAVTVSSSAAPLVAPEGIAPETGRENLTSGIVSRGPIEGIENSGGSSVGNLGVIEPPPPPPAPRTPVRLHSGITAPRKIVDAQPVYPELAKLAKQQGIVIIEATIDENGDVTAAKVLRSLSLLDEAALNAVRRWKFTAARLNGDAIPVVITVTVNFKLE